MITGVGIDIVDIKRFKTVLERWGHRFLSRVFSEGELRYALARNSPEAHLAARFAAKEALFKAIGPEFVPPFRFRDIEVMRDEGGRPLIKILGLADEIKVHVSLSHDADIAMAQVVVEKIK
ncbi:MAG: holo-ACP synthase [Deltaproteobacteria bacterium]|nr:holo-ACP synthase [Deltaproteobacteria bacterium]